MKPYFSNYVILRSGRFQHKKTKFKFQACFSKCWSNKCSFPKKLQSIMIFFVLRTVKHFSDSMTISWIPETIQNEISRNINFSDLKEKINSKCFFYSFLTLVHAGIFEYKICLCNFMNEGQICWILKKGFFFFIFEEEKILSSYYTTANK